MEAVVELQAKLLECHICLEMYRRPKTIPCLHSFCEECLQEYIANCREVKDASFPCPICKQVVHCPDPKLPLTQWASSFKVSFFLNDLSDCLKQAVSPSLTLPCSVCDRRNAVKYCIDCDHKLCHECCVVHNKIPTSQNHEVVNQSDCNSPHVLRRRRRFCREHPGHALVLYCNSCSLPICESCQVTFHMHCQDVTSLADTAKKKREWLMELMMQTRAYIVKLKSKNDEMNQNIEAANIMKVQNSEKLKEFFIKTMHALHKKQEKLMMDFERISQSRIKPLNEGRSYQEELLTALYNARDLTQSLVDVGSDWEIMQEADSDLTQQVECLIQRVNSLSCPVRLETSLELDSDCMAAITENLEKLSLKMYRSLSTPASPISSSPSSKSLFSTSPILPPPQLFPTTHTPKLVRRIRSKTSLDKEKPEIWDMVVLPAGQLILLDAANSCLKGMNMGTSTHTVYRLNLKSPLRLCKLSDTEVVVTCHDRKLYVVCVTDQLETTTCTRTAKEYWGVARIKEATLAASCLDSNCVDIIDLKGTVLNSISHDASGKVLFQRPSYLGATNDGDIVVSDCVKRCIYRLSPTGEVRFKYPCSGPLGLRNPRSVCCDSDGSLMCVDKEGQKVVRLTALGKFAGDVLTTVHGLSYPEAVTFRHSGEIYVTSDPNTDTQDVLVFDFV